MVDFEDLLRTLTADGDLSEFPVEGWRAAIDGAVDGARPHEIADMARAAHGRSAPAWDKLFRERLSAAIGEGSPSGLRLFAVLAGCALVRAYKHPVMGPLAMYCSIGASHAGWDPELRQATVGAEDLRAAAYTAREVPPMRPAKITLTAASYESHIPPPGGPVTGDQLRAVLNAMSRGVTDALSRGQQALTRAAESRELALREQVGMLRWLLSGYSGAADAPWGSLTPGEAALAAAVDLDALTRFKLGVPDAHALLAQTVALAGKSVASEPERADRLRTFLPDPGPVADLVPVLERVRADAVWSDGDTEKAQAAVDLYNELRLVHAYGDRQ